jgi:hypothetical protein
LSIGISLALGVILSQNDYFYDLLLLSLLTVASTIFGELQTAPACEKLGKFI